MKANQSIALLAIAVLASWVTAANAKVAQVYWVPSGEKILQSDNDAAGCNARYQVWCRDPPRDGETANTPIVTAAGNETVSFTVVINTDNAPTQIQSVTFSSLAEAEGKKRTLKSGPPCSDDRCSVLYRWEARDIELFKAGYVKVRGVPYGIICEQQRPPLGRRGDLSNTNVFADGCAGSMDIWASDFRTSMGHWEDRPVAGKNVPDPLVPMELYPNGFVIPAGTSQMVWIDITIPKNFGPATLTGNIVVQERDGAPISIPVELRVRGFDLDDFPFDAASSNEATVVPMAYLEVNQALRRFLGEPVNCDSPANQEIARTVVDNYYLMAHRHRIRLFSGTDCPPATNHTVTNARLDGTLFSLSNGYRGPGIKKGNRLYVIQPYSDRFGSSYAALSDQEAEGRFKEVRKEVVEWLKPDLLDKGVAVDYFLYFCDEPLCMTGPCADRVNNPRCYETDVYDALSDALVRFRKFAGTEVRVPLMATMSLPETYASHSVLPDVVMGAIEAEYDDGRAATEVLRNRPDLRFGLYGPTRPFAGSFDTDDSVSALREVMWAAAAKHVPDLMQWNVSYYCDSQRRGRDCSKGAHATVKLYSEANTFGEEDRTDPYRGQTGRSGDGVLFYPGTDVMVDGDKDFPDTNGPIPSIRVKMWRRGSEDLAYIRAYLGKNPSPEKLAKVEALTGKLIGKSFWDFSAEQIDSRGWLQSHTCWTDASSDWEKARTYLGDLIEGRNVSLPTFSGYSCWGR
ncbi:MAG: DUF4091 domain-containing protein [Rhodospirillaceae bacterium]|nr:DUF4091 domain-containing protein [Rhodospirillaceae bacterium]